VKKNLKSMNIWQSYKQEPDCFMHFLRLLAVCWPGEQSARESRVRCMFRFSFLTYLFFNDSCQTNYLNIYWTDRRQICRVGRTMPVDDQAEITFTIPPWTLSWQPIFVDFFHKLSSGDIRQMALAYGKKCN